MAALATVEEVLRRDQRWRVTMLGEEPGRVYDRIGLSKLVAGSCNPDSLELKPSDWYEAESVDLHAGRPAASLSLDRGTAVAVDGSEHSFDALVLATGSRPFVPPIPGVDARPRARLPHPRRRPGHRHGRHRGPPARWWWAAACWASRPPPGWWRAAWT